MIKRDDYINKMYSYKDKDVIKVVTGVRRCGKSTIFDLYVKKLLSDKVLEDNIIRINLEDPKYFELNDYLKLYNFIKNQIKKSEQKYYVFIDEVQTVPEFQKACNGLYLDKNIDLYITGSNAYLLSGELATLLSGRYVEIKVLPLSFKEYKTVYKEETNIDRLYNKYVSHGAFPYITSLADEDQLDDYIRGIFDTIILKDVVYRHNYTDSALLESIVYFMMDNISNLTSTNKITNTLCSQSRKISVNTTENYLTSLTEAFIFYKASRYDIKGKEYLKTGDKYYVVDTGLRYFLLGRKEGDIGHNLENIVYLELLRRNYKVYIGKVDNYEVDFVAINKEGITYFQVSSTVKASETLERELKPLKLIKDSYPKYLITSDITPKVNIDGITKINITDWLLDLK